MVRIERMVWSVMALLVLGGCASKGSRTFVDSSTHSDDPPDWVRSTKVSWEKDGLVYVKASHNLKVNDRIPACFDLAKLNAKENILSEIANDVRGRIDNAQQTVSENAETVLGKARSGEFEGRLLGLRFTEEYYEKYNLADSERLDCHVLGQMKQKDYDSVRRAVVDRVIAADPRLKEAVAQKQLDFFGGKNEPPAADKDKH